VIHFGKSYTSLSFCFLDDDIQVLITLSDCFLTAQAWPGRILFLNVRRECILGQAIWLEFDYLRLTGVEESARCLRLLLTSSQSSRR
jgi:hypothetical protein